MRGRIRLALAVLHGVICQAAVQIKVSTVARTAK